MEILAKLNLTLRKIGTGVYVLCYVDDEEGVVKDCVCVADCGCDVLYKLISLLYGVFSLSSAFRLITLGHNKFFILLPTCPVFVSQKILSDGEPSAEFCDFARWLLGTK